MGLNCHTQVAQNKYVFKMWILSLTVWAETTWLISVQAWIALCIFTIPLSMVNAQCTVHRSPEVKSKKSQVRWMPVLLLVSTEGSYLIRTYIRLLVDYQKDISKITSNLFSRDFWEWSTSTESFSAVQQLLFCLSWTLSRALTSPYPGPLWWTLPSLEPRISSPLRQCLFILNLTLLYPFPWTPPTLIWV